MADYDPRHSQSSDAIKAFYRAGGRVEGKKAAGISVEGERLP